MPSELCAATRRADRSTILTSETTTPGQGRASPQKQGVQFFRWVTLGLAEDNTLLVVVHTLEEVAENQAWVRIISARAATGPERKQ